MSQIHFTPISLEELAQASDLVLVVEEIGGETTDTESGHLKHFRVIETLVNRSDAVFGNNIDVLRAHDDDHRMFEGDHDTSDPLPSPAVSKYGSSLTEEQLLERPACIVFLKSTCSAEADTWGFEFAADTAYESVGLKSKILDLAGKNV